MSKRHKSHTPLVNPANTQLAIGKINQITVSTIPTFINNTHIRDADNDSVHKIVSQVRQSMEYKQYMRYLKQNMDFTKCTFLPFLHSGMNGSNNTAKINIEIHHTPFKLDEIVRTVCNKHIMDHDFADEFRVADEVMQLHYRNIVGLIPLSSTVHELIHNDQAEVPPSLVYGYWKQFIVEYKPYFCETAQHCFDRLSEWENTIPGKIPHSLEVKYSLVYCEGIPVYQTLALEDMSKIEEAIDFNNTNLSAA